MPPRIPAGPLPESHAAAGPLLRRARAFPHQFRPWLRRFHHAAAMPNPAIGPLAALFPRLLSCGTAVAMSTETGKAAPFVCMYREGGKLCTLTVDVCGSAHPPLHEAALQRAALVRGRVRPCRGQHFAHFRIRTQGGGMTRNSCARMVATNCRATISAIPFLRGKWKPCCTPTMHA